MPRSSSHHRLHLTVAGGYLVLALVLGFLVPEFGWRILPGFVARLAPDSAIAMLSAIASGMMALTGIAFSLVFVFFQLSNSAYTPRLVSEFAGNPIASHALGTFTGTFVYATLAIRTVGLAGRSDMHGLVAWVAFGWLLASVVALVLLTASIRQVSMAQVLSGIGQHGLQEVRSRYQPFVAPHARATSTGAAALDAAPTTQVITHAGAPLYVVKFDHARLLAAARASEGLVFIPYALGDAVIPGDALAVIRGGTRRIPERAVRDAVMLRRDRNVDQNPAYALRLLADIAIRALSPAINDPTSAVMALDQLEALLRAFGGADLERGIVRDQDGATRAVYMHPTWEDLLSLALSEIAQYGQQSAQVQRRLGALLTDLAELVPEPRRAAVEQLLLHRARVLEQAPIGADDRSLAFCQDRQGLGHTLAPRR